MDQPSEDRLAKVHPLLAAKIRAMASILMADDPPIPIRVTQGLRTWDEQDALYQQGRTKPGKVVTNAKPGFSYHNYALAVDLVPMTPLGPDWDPTHPNWRRMIEVGKSVGLQPGAMWRSFPDMPHFQLVGNLQASPSPQIRTLYTTEGLEAVWKATGLPTGSAEEQPA